MNEQINDYTLYVIYDFEGCPEFEVLLLFLLLLNVLLTNLLAYHAEQIK